MNPDSVPQPEESILVNGIQFSHGDLAKVVDVFYGRIQEDPELKIPFQSVHDWPEHIRRLTHFWWIRFGGRPYLFAQYNPVGKHFYAGFNEVLLARWLRIFHETMSEILNPDQTRLWTLISQRMGQSLTMKNEMMKEEYGNPKGENS